MQGKGNVAIGIDLGTTFSCIAVYKNNKIEIIPNEMGDPTTPSIVTFYDNKIYAGEETLRIQTKDPKNTIYGVKRLIGRYFEDKEVQKEIEKYWTFKVEPGEKQDKGHLPVIVVDYEGKKQKFAPEKISSFFLSKLKRSAERHLKTQVDNCVVTIPAHFREEQKNATIKACKDAGFNVLGTLNEPEAAALAFGLETENRKPKKGETPRGEDERNILIFDLGGGTFDVSILQVKNLVFEDKGKYGDPHFGGEDFDNALVDYCIEKFYEMKKIKIDKNNDPAPMKRLKMSCENAKKILSIKETTQIEISDLKDNEDLFLEITRDLFEQICGPLFDKCISPIYDLLNHIGISAGAIDHVVLIGGSTKIPRIRKMIKSIFYQEPNTSINPDEAVASGAAIVAAKLSGLNNKNIENILIKDITPFTLGIAVFSPQVSPVLMLLNFLNNLEKIEEKKDIERNVNDALFMNSVIKKGSPIPFENTKIYHTLHDNQEEVEIEVYEGESALVKENNLLGKFRIKNLPKKKAGEVEFDVTFKIDANGILTVTAQLRENRENKEQLLVESYKGGVSKNEYNLIQNIASEEVKDNKFLKMRDLGIEMNKYYDKIVNPKKDEDEEEEDDDEDEDVKKEKREEKEFNIICNYSNCIEELIALFNKKDLENEAILEKIFQYLEKLFNSYKMALKIKSQANKDFQKKLIDKILDYYSKFFELKIFWLPNLLEILKGTPIKFFIECAIGLMNFFLMKGQLYQMDSKSENFNKYYAKQYYKAALDICEKYKLDKEKDKVERDAQKKYLDLKNKCLAGLNNLDSEYLMEIQNTLSSNKLVSNDLINNKERLYLLSDAFHLNLSKLDGLEDKDSFKIIAFSYANIIKIDFKLLKNLKNLKTLNDYATKCIEISQKIGINTKKAWFKEFLEIKNEIDEKMRKDEEENNEEKRKIKENMMETLNGISKKAKEMEKCDFIKFIIENYPPIGYKKEDDYVKKFKENPEKALEDLTTVYHTSNYHGKDVTYEKYLIIEQIETELNKIKTFNKESIHKINIE